MFISPWQNGIVHSTGGNFKKKNSCPFNCYLGRDRESCRIESAHCSMQVTGAHLKLTVILQAHQGSLSHHLPPWEPLSGSGIVCVPSMWSVTELWAVSCLLGNNVTFLPQIRTIPNSAAGHQERCHAVLLEGSDLVTEGEKKLPSSAHSDFYKQWYLLFSFHLSCFLNWNYC